MFVYLLFNISLKQQHFAPLKHNILHAHLVLVNWPQIVYKLLRIRRVGCEKTFDVYCWKSHRCKWAL